jgi:prepilin-type N-terminal cleavage/methylation domain-containing protein
MKKRIAFTLIELLVVIAIIAILAAILFPVFAQSRLAAKRTVGLAQTKQIGTSMLVYIADVDDRLFPMRTNSPNPAYTSCMTAGRSDCSTIFGTNARPVTFWNQLLYPYVKNKDIFKSSGKPNAWVDEDTSGKDVMPADRSYGGNNSFGLNTAVFEAEGFPMCWCEIEGDANTVVLLDASNVSVFPKFNGLLRRFAGQPKYTAACTDPMLSRHWKNMGNGSVSRWNGSTNIEPTDQEATKQINARWSGRLNVIMADTSARARESRSVTDDLLRPNSKDSMWDPWKQGMIACP